MNDRITEETDTLYCKYHPKVETSLRCNNCNAPICAKCAVLTPTGYRCKECLRNHQKKFNTAQWYDYPLAIFIAGILSYLGSLLASVLGFFTIFIAPIAGMVIAEAVRRATQRRRSKFLFQICAGAAAIGSIPLVLPLLFVILGGANLFAVLWPLLWQSVYTITVTTTVYYRLRGIQI